MYGEHMYGFGGVFMWLFWILIIVVVVWVIKAAASSGCNNPSEKRQTALDILKERYAKGEIDQEEFERKRKDIDD